MYAATTFVLFGKNCYQYRNSAIQLVCCAKWEHHCMHGQEQVDLQMDTVRRKLSRDPTLAQNLTFS